MSINPIWMKECEERSAHLDDNDNHVNDTTYLKNS